MARRDPRPPSAAHSRRLQRIQCAWLLGRGRDRGDRRMGHNQALLPPSRCQAPARWGCPDCVGHTAHIGRVHRASAALHVPGCPNHKSGRGRSPCLRRAGGLGSRHGGSGHERRAVIPEFHPPTGRACRWQEQRGRDIVTVSRNSWECQ